MEVGIHHGARGTLGLLGFGAQFRKIGVGRSRFTCVADATPFQYTRLGPIFGASD
ncbi:MAG: hypothetical protein KCHDKBKB_01794 [Elusimicrobia bacterium]|nr:hypothetical protein [Elusimicrobiota bacterium]